MPSRKHHLRRKPPRRHHHPIVTEIPTTEPYSSIITTTDMTIIPWRRGTRPPVHSTESHNGQDISTTIYATDPWHDATFTVQRQNTTNNNNKYDMTSSVWYCYPLIPLPQPPAPLPPPTVVLVLHSNPFPRSLLYRATRKTKGSTREQDEERERPLQRQLLTFVCVCVLKGMTISSSPYKTMSSCVVFSHPSSSDKAKKQQRNSSTYSHPPILPPPTHHV